MSLSFLWPLPPRNWCAPRHMRGLRARMKHGASIENHSSWRRFFCLRVDFNVNIIHKQPTTHPVAWQGTDLAGDPFRTHRPSADTLAAIAAMRARFEQRLESLWNKASRSAKVAASSCFNPCTTKPD
ncbi:hypothetical protein JAO85_19375 [Comamonas sp. NyZ500]|uniref:hypothetical protein n=1 Tax=Comamonas TaxID=283 RepID=UPI0013DAE5AB|nr:MULTISPECIES: hypothetical protein [Comamonas]MBL5979440.1 hypothetical protein [Comamonas sp. NyZ500]